MNTTPQQSATPTPRMDAEDNEDHDLGALCRQLETELTAAREIAQKYEDRYFSARAEVERLNGICNEQFNKLNEVHSLRAQLQAKEQELEEANTELEQSKITFAQFRNHAWSEQENLRQQLAARDATIAGLRGALKVARTFLDIDTPEGALTHIDGHLAQVPPTPLPAVAPKPDALALTSFCGLPADALEKHLKACPPDCDPAVWQPDATQATGEAQPKDTQ